MFRHTLRFELGYQLRQPAFWVSFGVFFLLTFLAIANDNVQIGSGGGTHANAPFAVTQVTMIMSLIGMFIPVAIIPGTVLRDPDTGMAGIVYSLPLSRAGFLLGRFSGAFLVVATAFLGAPLGMMVGSFMWWLDPETLGPFRPGDYGWAFLLFALPNLLITSALFFATAAITRSQWAVYSVMIGLLVFWAVSGQLIQGPENQSLEAMLDPFGLRAAAQAMRYWTVFERNSMLVPFQDTLMWNRIVWTGISLVLVAGAVALFRFETQARRAGNRKDEAEPEAPVSLERPIIQPAPAGTVGLRQLVATTLMEARAVIKAPGFLVILALGVFNSTGALVNMGGIYGTDVYPVTRVVAELILGTFGIVPFIIVIYYSAELVWRDRQQRVHEIVTACPVPGWVFVVSKLAALTLVLASLFTVASLVGVLAQLLRGFTDIEPSIYLTRFFYFFGLPMLMFGVLAILIQTISPNKFIGMLALIGYMLLTMVAAQLGLVDNLLIYSSTPTVLLSDMNGWGHFAEAASWFTLYWGFAALFLMVLSHRLWPGAVPAPAKVRLKGLARGWRGAPAAIAAFALAGFIGTGSWIAHNTHGLNEVVSSDEAEEQQVAFEKAYRQYEGLPQPTIIAVKTDMDLYPEIRRYEARGTYVLENRTGAPLTEVHVVYDSDRILTRNELDGATVAKADKDFGYYIFKLDAPMQPGELRELRFTVVEENPGFKNDNDITRIVHNGTFVDSSAATPFIGFPERAMLQDKSARRKHGLEPIDRMADLDDTTQHDRNYLRSDSHWVTFETTVSTSADQIAIAPGYLQKEWEENGRRYFHYKMDAPILNFYSWLSARYTVKRDSWEGIDLAVYYHRPHWYNVDRMIDSMKKSLGYFSSAFSPYQHKQLRILEFPAYATFAQAFPNTVPYSEGIGFIADNRDPEDIDYVFYVTAHEVAHQWWAHQVIGANVQGSTALSETLAQYSALMVMEKEYGSDKIRRFLKYELDQYLRGRGSEDREERPLYRVENQPYIHYRKGSLVMYALKDHLGEATVNRALARLIQETAYRSTPYPTSRDLLRILREEAGPDHQQLITDLFERIVLFDLKVKDQKVEPVDGKYKVTLTLSTAKAEADGQGKETPLAMDDMVDIGLFTRDPGDVAFGPGDVLHLQKHRITGAEPVIELVVDKAPTVVGIDPYNKLIDRNSDDNLVRGVTVE